VGQRAICFQTRKLDSRKLTQWEKSLNILKLHLKLNNLFLVKIYRDVRDVFLFASGVAREKARHRPSPGYGLLSAARSQLREARVILGWQDMATAMVEISAAGDKC